MKCDEFRKTLLEVRELEEKELFHLKECRDCKELYEIHKELLFLFKGLNKAKPDEEIFKKIKRKILIHRIISSFSIYYIVSLSFLLPLSVFLIENLNLQNKLLILIDHIMKFRPLLPFLIKGVFILCIPFMVSVSLILIFIGFLSFIFLRKGSIPLFKFVRI